MKVLPLLLFGLATVFVSKVNSSNILFISFFSGKSNKLTYIPLIEELGKRGHNITVVSPVKPMKEMKNVKEILTFDFEELFKSSQINPFDQKEKGQKFDLTLMTSLIYDVCEKSLDLSQVRDLLTEKFDLVFLQSLFNDCILGLVYRLQVPFVVFTPTSVPPFIVSKVGGYFPSAVAPNFMLGFPPEMTFYQRFLNFGMDVMTEVYIGYMYEPNVEKIYREKLGADIPSINEIYANASLLFSNGHFSLNGPAPNFPDVVDVGGIHSRPAKPIPQNLEDFIRKGKDGFILFSMGTAIKGDAMPETKRKMILNVFSKLKQQILWKWESESMLDLPKNVLLSKWLPQQDLLGHKDIKMFITHCGGGSTEESIYHGVPLVGIPMLADQPKNAKTAREKGFLVELDWNNLTEENFGNAINEVLTNPSYRDNVQRLSSLFKDRPTSPLDLGVYWMEYVIRHKGAHHLRNVGRKLNTFQYRSYDVICAYFALIGIALYLIFAFIRFTCKKVRSFFQRGRSSSPVKKEKTN